MQIQKKYFIGVAIAVLVLTCNQVFIQYWLQQKAEDAAVINIAGRQRMLSQRINLELYKIHHGNSQVAEVTTFISDWKKAHNALLYGDASMEIDAIDDPSAIELLHRLTPVIDSISNAVATNDFNNAIVLEKATQQLDAFLQTMDMAVKALESRANDKLKFIVITEIILALISITIIVVEVVYIYSPISAQLEKQLKQIKDSEKNLTEKNKKLKRIAEIQSHELRRPLANILGLVHLIQNDDRKEFNEVYLEKLKDSAEELDSHIHEIVANTKTLHEVDKKDS